MELVYLWVEEYKNIQKQEFNFSPRFNCHYDGETLTINENDDYIENFFGENINVTAIVGKNGSGKSSVLEFLLLKEQRGKNKNFIFIYLNSFNRLEIYTNKKIIVATDIPYKQLGNIKYNEEDKAFKMIFSFAQYLARENHPKLDNQIHPNWEKNIIKLLIEVFKDKNIHFVLTSHSPFLLSDIPKQNIIFLDTFNEKDDEVKNEEQKIGNCKVVDGLKEKKQTFGANIHTLLSDSFFMEDGLMGEFAKGKINEIINFHKEVEKENANIDELKKEYEDKRDKFYQTQSIVGEEYLKQILDNHLMEIDKILLGKARAKESKRARLEAELKALDDD